LCARVILLDGGRVVSTGTPAALVAASGITPRLVLRSVRPLPAGWLSELPGTTVVGTGSHTLTPTLPGPAPRSTAPLPPPGVPLPPGAGPRRGRGAGGRPSAPDPPRRVLLLARPGVARRRRARRRLAVSELPAPSLRFFALRALAAALAKELRLLARDRAAL